MLLFLFIGCSEESKVDYRPGMCFREHILNVRTQINYIKITKEEKLIGYTYVATYDNTTGDLERAALNDFGNLYRKQIDCSEYQNSLHLVEKRRLLKRIKKLEEFHKPKKKKKK